MNALHLRDSTARSVPPDGLSIPLQALWWSRKGDWDQAHRLAQEANSPDGDWVHAFLHRVEGDESNARYWYAKAGRAAMTGDFDDEWRKIVTELS